MNLDPIYLIYIFSAIAAVLVVEAIYLLVSTSKSYRNRINRRLVALSGNEDRQSILIQLRRERGLSESGTFVLPIESLNRLILQSGLTLGAWKFILMLILLTLVSFSISLILRSNVTESIIWALGCGIAIPLFVLRFMRNKRHKKFGEMFPDAIDIIVRSLRAGHPVPIAISMVARELPDPVGTEFGMASDEVTYGSDLETAMRHLYFRVGQEDLPLFVTAIAIQGQTGGNLSEILENLSSVLRQRFKMRRKIVALSSEGRFSALALTAMPLALLLILQISSPNYYGEVWDHPTLQKTLGFAGGWMLFGNYIMFKMVNFKI